MYQFKQTAKTKPQFQQQPTLEPQEAIANTYNSDSYAAILNRSPANQHPPSPKFLLQLQRQYGNRYVNQILQQVQQSKQTTNKPRIPQQETQNRKELAARSASDIEQTEKLGNIFAAAKKGTVTEVPFRQEMEVSFGQDFSTVQAYLNQSAPMKKLGAYAATEGETIVFAANNPSKELVAHELAHVAQNRQASVSNSLQAKSEIIQGNSPAEQEADAVAKKAVAGQLVKVQAKPTANIQCKGEYRKLAQSDSEKADELVANAEKTYYEAAEVFEEKLGYFLADHPLSMQAAELMLKKIKQIFEVWAKEVRKNLDATLKQGFGPARVNESAQGGVRDTINTFNYLFKQGNLREKMNLAYQSIRNESLPKALEQARQDLLIQSQASKKWQKLKLNTDYLISNELKDKVEVQEDDTKYIDYRAYFTRKDLVEKQDRQSSSKEVYNQFFKQRETVGEMAKGGKQIPLSYHELKKAYPDQAIDLKQKQGSKKWNKLSKKEKGKLLTEQVKEEKIPWVGGISQYEIGEKLRSYAEELKVILVAGHSGSTDLYMHAADYLGLNQAQKQLIRLACLGVMIPPKNHSFYEVMIVAKEYGLTDYEPKPEAYRKIAPLTENDIQKGTGVKEFPDYYLSEDYLDEVVKTSENMPEITNSKEEIEEIKPESKEDRLMIIPDDNIKSTDKKQKKDKNPSMMSKLIQGIKKKLSL